MASKQAPSATKPEAAKPELLTPTLYTSKAGNVSIQLGRDFHGAAVWRQVVASIMDDKNRAKLLALCDQMERAEAQA